MNYREIHAADPGGTEAEAFAALSAMTTTMATPITSSGLNKWAAKHKQRNAIETDAANIASPTQEYSKAALFALNNTTEPLDVTDPEILSMVDALKANGVIDQAAYDDLIASGSSDAPMFDGLELADIIEARRRYG